MEEFLRIMDDWSVTPTIFATHDCSVVKNFRSGHPREVGLHPNPRPGSTQGESIAQAFDYLLRIYPGAPSFRSHRFFDSSELIQAAIDRDIRYDSNLCLHLQPNVVPLRLGVPGMTRLPVFWEDDVHWLQTGGDWRPRRYLSAFSSPGLKIINVHPFMIAANIPDAAYYRRIKKHITKMTRADLDRIRHKGPGARTFLEALIKSIKSKGQRFYTLDEIFRKFPVKSLR